MTVYGTIHFELIGSKSMSFFKLTITILGISEMLMNWLASLLERERD